MIVIALLTVLAGGYYWMTLENGSHDADDILSPENAMLPVNNDNYINEATDTDDMDEEGLLMSGEEPSTVDMTVQILPDQSAI